MKTKPPRTLNVVHMPGQLYGEPTALTPLPRCPECNEDFINTSGQYSSCPNGHGGLRTPLVETGKWVPLKNEKIQAARNTGTLVLGQVPNKPVGKTKTSKHPKDITKGQKVE